MKTINPLFCTPVLALATAFIACSCAKQEPCCPAPAPTPVLTTKQLNELSQDQLRVFLRGYAGDWRNGTDMSRGKPPPPIQTSISDDAQIIDLPSPDTFQVGRLPLVQAVTQRRSLREYADTPLTMEELSYLLWCTQGVSLIEYGDGGDIVNHYRTVPSGGARHPFETYLAVNRVEGLTPGIYRFLPFGHKICLLQAMDDLSLQLTTAAYGQTFPADSAVMFVWATVPERTEWKYGYIAHRMIAIEAGHVCQNLYLAAESIDAGACAMLGYSQPHMDALIGVDGKDEFTIYTAAGGKKVAGD